ncbi:MAG: LysR family transcriptional regulator [Pseudomonadota bacterium]
MPQEHLRHSLSLRQIEVFHAVMKTKSITAAAELLSVSQPSLSRTIKRVEDILGVTLFRRDNRGLVPSSEAQKIYKEIDGIVRQLTGLDEKISEITTGTGSLFRLGATPSVARALVPQALNTLTQNATTLELFFDVLSIEQMEDYLVTGQGECLVTISPIEHPMFDTRHLGSGELLAIVPNAHRLAERSVLKLEDLTVVDLISFQPAGPHQSIIETFLGKAAERVKTSAVVRFSDTAIALANQGMGIALVDSFSAMGPLGNNVVVRPIANAPAFEVYLQWNKRRAQSQYVEEFGTIISEHIDHR